MCRIYHTIPYQLCIGELKNVAFPPLAISTLATYHLCESGSSTYSMPIGDFPFLFLLIFLFFYGQRPPRKPNKKQWAWAPSVR